MSLVSIRVDDEMLKEVKAHAHRLQLSQTDYIRKAIEQMNDAVSKEERKKALEAASLRVRHESMKINAAFSEIEYDSEL